MTIYKFNVSTVDGTRAELWVNSDKPLQETINSVEIVFTCQVVDYEIMGSTIAFATFYKDSCSVLTNS